MMGIFYAMSLYDIGSSTELFAINLVKGMVKNLPLLRGARNS